MKRRVLLFATVAVSTPLCGCSELSSEPEGEGTEVEVIPTNSTEKRIDLDVAIFSKDGDTLLEHSYSLPAGHSDESQGVENRVGHVEVSLDGGDVVRHDYSPDLDVSCEGEDVQIWVQPDGIEFAYSC